MSNIVTNEQTRENIFKKTNKDQNILFTFSFSQGEMSPNRSLEPK